MIQNEDSFFPKASVMSKLHQNQFELQTEKKEYEKYRTYLNNEINDLITKNEQLLSCFISHKEIFEDLILQIKLLEERYTNDIIEESHSKRIKMKLNQIKNRQDPMNPSRVLIPMENNTENRHVQLAQEFSDLEKKVSKIDIDQVKVLIDEKRKLSKKHIELKKEADFLMSQLIKPENKQSKQVESLFYHMMSAMSECNKNRQKLFALKHEKQVQYDSLSQNSDDNLKTENIDILDLLKLFPDIQPSPKLQELLNQEIEKEKIKEAKRKRIEAMKKKDEEFLRNLNHRQRNNYYPIKPPPQKKSSNPNESISDEWKGSKSNRIRISLNNQNTNQIPISSPPINNSVVPAPKRTGRRPATTVSYVNTIQVPDNKPLGSGKHRKRHHKKDGFYNLDPPSPTEIASSSSTSSTRKREENRLLSNQKQYEKTLSDNNENSPKYNKNINNTEYKNEILANDIHQEKNEENDKNSNKKDYLSKQNQKNINDSEDEKRSPVGDDFEFDQVLEADKNWRFKIEPLPEKENENNKEGETANDPAKNTIFKIDHNPKKFVEEENQIGHENNANAPNENPMLIHKIKPKTNDHTKDKKGENKSNQKIKHAPKKSKEKEETESDPLMPSIGTIIETTINKLIKYQSPNAKQEKKTRINPTSNPKSSHKNVTKTPKENSENKSKTDKKVHHSKTIDKYKDPRYRIIFMSNSSQASKSDERPRAQSVQNQHILATNARKQRQKRKNKSRVRYDFPDNFEIEEKAQSDSCVGNEFEFNQVLEADKKWRFKPQNVERKPNQTKSNKKEKTQVEKQPKVDANEAVKTNTQKENKPQLPEELIAIDEKIDHSRIKQNDNYRIIFMSTSSQTSNANQMNNIEPTSPHKRKRKHRNKAKDQTANECNFEEEEERNDNKYVLTFPPENDQQTDPFQDLKALDLNASRPNGYNEQQEENYRIIYMSTSSQASNANANQMKKTEETSPHRRRHHKHRNHKQEENEQQQLQTNDECINDFEVEEESQDENGFEFTQALDVDMKNKLEQSKEENEENQPNNDGAKEETKMDIINTIPTTVDQLVGKEEQLEESDDPLQSLETLNLNANKPKHSREEQNEDYRIIYMSTSSQISNANPNNNIKPTDLDKLHQSQENDNKANSTNPTENTQPENVLNKEEEEEQPEENTSQTKADTKDEHQPNLINTIPTTVDQLVGKEEQSEESVDPLQSLETLNLNANKPKHSREEQNEDYRIIYMSTSSQISNANPNNNIKPTDLDKLHQPQENDNKANSTNPTENAQPETQPEKVENKEEEEEQPEESTHILTPQPEEPNNQQALIVIEEEEEDQPNDDANEENPMNIINTIPITVDQLIGSDEQSEESIDPLQNLNTLNLNADKPKQSKEEQNEDYKIIYMSNSSQKSNANPNNNNEPTNAHKRHHKHKHKPQENDNNVDSTNPTENTQPEKQPETIEYEEVIEEVKEESVYILTPIPEDTQQEEKEEPKAQPTNEKQEEPKPDEDKETQEQPVDFLQDISKLNLNQNEQNIDPNEDYKIVYMSTSSQTLNKHKHRHKRKYRVKTQGDDTQEDSKYEPIAKIRIQIKGQIKGKDKPNKEEESTSYPKETPKFKIDHKPRQFVEEEPTPENKPEEVNTPVPRIRHKHKHLHHRRSYHKDDYQENPNEEEESASESEQSEPLFSNFIESTINQLLNFSGSNQKQGKHPAQSRNYEKETEIDNDFANYKKTTSGNINSNKRQPENFRVIYMSNSSPLQKAPTTLSNEKQRKEEEEENDYNISPQKSDSSASLTSEALIVNPSRHETFKEVNNLSSNEPKLIDPNNGNKKNVKLIKKKRSSKIEIDKKPVIIDEQKKTIENLEGKPRSSHHSDKNRRHKHHKLNESYSSDDNNNNNDNDDDDYEYNYEYDYVFDDKDYYSNDNKHTKKTTHNHHYRRTSSRSFRSPPGHTKSRSHSSSRVHFGKKLNKKPSEIRAKRKDSDDSEEEQKGRNKSHFRRTRREKPSRIRRHREYYSDSSDSYNDQYLSSASDDGEYGYSEDKGKKFKYNSDYDYDYEIVEKKVFAPLKLQISKEMFSHEVNDVSKNPRVFQRKIIPKQIKESKTFAQFETLNDFVVHEPNEAFESLRKRGRGDQIDIEIANVKDKLSKIDNDINGLQKQLKNSLLKNSSAQVDDQFSMQGLASMKNEIKNNENSETLLNQAKQQKELLKNELTDKQNQLNDLQKQYVRKTATLRHYKQLKDELNEQSTLIIGASKKQMKKLNDLDEQIRKGRRKIEIIDGRIADLRNIIDMKTKELSVKASKKRPDVVGMCGKFKRDRVSEKEILQLIEYHDIERQYLEKAIEASSYQLSDDSLTKKEFEIERIVIIAQNLKKKFFDKRGMSNQTMITLTNEDDMNMLTKRKSLTKEEIHSTMMQIDLAISQIQKQMTQLKNQDVEIPPPPGSFLDLQEKKRSRLENTNSIS